MASTRTIMFNVLAMLLCALLTRVTVQFFTVQLAPLAIMAMMLSLGIALLTAGASPIETGAREDAIALLAGVALTVTMYLSLLTNLPGAAFYAITLGGSLSLLVYGRARIAKEFSASAGLLAGFVMFIVALMLSLFLQFTGIATAEETIRLLSGFNNANVTLQTDALANMLVVAPVEELWRYGYIAAMLAAGGGAEAAWMANAWFIFLHAPTRLRHGLLGLVVLVIIGIVVIPFWYLAGRRHPVTAIIAHATYNVLIGSFGPALLIEVPILLLLIYLLRRKELPGISIQIREEELKPEALVRKVVGG